MIKAGVVGATGYTGEELVEVLLANDHVEITSLSALVEKEEEFSEIYPRFGGRISVKCGNLDVDEVSSVADIVFLALPHTVSMKIAPEFLKKGNRVIDLSADYRLSAELYAEWYGVKHSDTGNLKNAVYGMPELNRDQIKEAELVSNPGCYPTSVILGLLPLIATVAKEKIAVIVDSKSGVTGAGRKALIDLSFGEVDGDFKCYKINEHQHMPEMQHVLSGAAGSEIDLHFVPHLLPLRRGILSTIYISHASLPGENEIWQKYEDHYKDEPFVRVRPLGQLPRLRDVTCTNFCDIGLKVAGGMLVVVTVIDNLLKGASGQAAQNMNIMYGFDEREGLL